MTDKILVIKRDKVGDLLLATPMLRLLRESFPAAHIALLASDYSAWIVHGVESIDRVWVYRRARVGNRMNPSAALGQALLWMRLRRERYDIAIAANGEASPRATRRALLAGARRTIAYSDIPTRGLTDALPPPRAGHERDRMIALLAPLGIAAPRESPLPEWKPNDAALAAAHSWLAARGLRPGAYVVIGLGARRAKKQPGADQVLRWSQALHARAGLDTVFMWTPGGGDNPDYPGDDAIAAPVVAARAPQLHPFRGPLQPAAALAWLARRSLFPDSGLMHLAAASPGGVVGLFAETAISPAPAQWGPLGPRSDYLEAERNVAELDDEQVIVRLLAGEDRISPREVEARARREAAR